MPPTATLYKQVMDCLGVRWLLLQLRQCLLIAGGHLLVLAFQSFKQWRPEFCHNVCLHRRASERGPLSILCTQRKEIDCWVTRSVCV